RIRCGGPLLGWAGHGEEGWSAVGEVEQAGGQVAVAAVELAGAPLRSLQIGGQVQALVENLVVGAQQRAARALPLPGGVDSQDGQVMVGEVSRVVAFEGG